MKTALMPLLQARILMDQFSTIIAKQTAKAAAASMTPSQVASLLTNSPQTLVQPASYQVINLAPFDPPVYVPLLRHHLIVS